MRFRSARRSWLALAMVLAGTTVLGTTRPEPVAAASSPRVLLIGDSTLAALDWYPQSKAGLAGLDYTLRAASCRAVTATSCVGRRDASGRRVRPDNALSVLRSYGRDAFDELVLMVGYDESAASFARSVVDLPAEARRLGIDHITWLTFRTGGDYEAPTGDSSYRGNNRLLRAAASASNGYISLLDWNGHVASRSGLVERDGVHLTAAGAASVATLIARSTSAHWGTRAGRSGTDDDRTLSYGALGEEVEELQEALLRIGSAPLEPYGATGRFYAVTEEAVRRFQAEVRDRHDETMVVDGVVGPVTRSWLERLDPG